MTTPTVERIAEALGISKDKAQEHLEAYDRLTPFEKWCCERPIWAGPGLPDLEYARKYDAWAKRNPAR